MSGDVTLGHCSVAVPYLDTFVALLLALWCTSLYDAETAFLAVCAATALALSASLNLPSLALSVFPPTDHLRHVRAAVGPVSDEDWVALSAVMVVAALVFAAILAPGVWNKSPMMGLVFYSSVASTVLREQATVGVVRQVAVLCAILSGLLSLHVLRLNVAVILFFAAASLCQGLPKGLPVGSFETLALVCALGMLLVHDAAVRTVVHALGNVATALGMTAAAVVLVEAALELSSRSPPSSAIINASWERTFAVDRASALPVGSLLSVLPGMGAAFCAASALRIVLAHHAAISSRDVQELLGTAFGAGVGVFLWCQYAGVASVDVGSPVSALVVSAALLVRASAKFPDVLAPRADERLWHTSTWWRAQASSSVAAGGAAPAAAAAARSTKEVTIADGPADASTEGVRFLQSLSASVTPEVAAAVQQCVEAEARLLALEGKQGDDVPRWWYQCVLEAVALSKHADDLATKVRAVARTAESEVLVLVKVQGPLSPLALRAAGKRDAVFGELESALDYAEDKRTSLAAREDEALRLVDAAKAAAKSKPEEDAFEVMAEHIRKRKRAKLVPQSPARPGAASVRNMGGGGGVDVDEAASLRAGGGMRSASNGHMQTANDMSNSAESLVPEREPTRDDEASTKRRSGSRLFGFGKRPSSSGSAKQQQPPTLTPEREGSAGGSRKWRLFGSSGAKKPAVE